MCRCFWTQLLFTLLLSGSLQSITMMKLQHFVFASPGLTGIRSRLSVVSKQIPLFDSLASTSLFSSKSSAHWQQQSWSTRPRIYSPSLLSSTETLQLEGDESHYICNVMRCREGDTVRIFNSRDGEHLYEIIATPRKSGGACRLESIQLLRLAASSSSEQPPLPVTLFFAPIKKLRMKLVLEKATELGVCHLVPVLTQNCNMDYKWTTAQTSFQKLLVESVEQCERLSVPVLHEPIKFAQFLSIFDSSSINNSNSSSSSSSMSSCASLSAATAGLSRCFVCRERGSARPILEEMLSSVHELETVAITSSSASSASASARGVASVRSWGTFCGPEGGFTAEEFRMMDSLSNINSSNSINSNAPLLRFVSLGSNILRAETASLMAASCAVAVMDRCHSFKLNRSVIDSDIL